MTTNTSFYVQKPRDEYWNTGMANYVIEARNIDPSEVRPSKSQKTNEYVQNYLKVISPIAFGIPYVKRDMWVECKGPPRKLKFHDYVVLYHELQPNHPLPKGKAKF